MNCNGKMWRNACGNLQIRGVFARTMADRCCETHAANCKLGVSLCELQPIGVAKCMQQLANKGCLCRTYKRWMLPLFAKPTGAPSEASNILRFTGSRTPSPVNCNTRGPDSLCSNSSRRTSRGLKSCKLQDSEAPDSSDS